MMTREEIRAVYDQGPETVIALVERLYAAFAQLQGRVKELEDRLATSSRNSHKPPSSNGFVNERNFTSSGARFIDDSNAQRG